MANNTDYIENTLTLFNKFIEEFLINKRSLIDGRELVIAVKEVELFCDNLKNVTTLNKKKSSQRDSLEELCSEEENKKFKPILWHAYWIMYLMSETTTNKLFDWPEKKSDNKIKIDDKTEISLYIKEPIASTRQVYTADPIKPFKTFLRLFCSIWKKEQSRDKDTVKSEIIGFLNDGNESDKRIKNILLYLCDPQNYLPIISENHKNKIYNNLKNIVDDKSGAEKDNVLCKIEKKLEQLLGVSQNTKYNTCSAVYDPRIKPLWLKDRKTDELPSDILLEYKKAMVLYGPPGTGKTYTAVNLAKKVLFRHKFDEWVKEEDDKKKESKKKEIDDILNLKEDALEEHPNISYLQFHVNYTYDNVIAGQTVESKGDGTTLNTKPGFIYDIIAKANKAIEDAISANKKVNIEDNNNIIKIIEETNNNDNQKEEKNRIKKIKKYINKNKELQKVINAAPFIVILDEMNRVDVSRVFGELFTAIEKRGTDVFLTLPEPQDSTRRLKLNIPYNIYFIGTMNEIDFSLEQLDFALRRRFIWEFADYSENALEEIIKDKEIEQDNGDNNITAFLTNCTALNKKIEDELGEEYHIGHAFFAEISNIYQVLKENSTSKDVFKSAQNILWQISIKPTVEAYCGTMERETKKNFVDECRKIFIG